MTYQDLMKLAENRNENDALDKIFSMMKFIISQQLLRDKLTKQ